MSLNRLDATTDLADDRGRGLLQETLDIYAVALRNLRAELDAVKDADRIVRPYSIREFPVAAGQIYTGEEGGEIADISWRATDAPPVGTVACNGASYPTAQFPDLFAIIGYTYGGAGANFNMPDLQGRSMKGLGVASSGGGTNWSLGLEHGHELLQSHIHNLSSHVHDMGSHTHAFSIYTQDATGTPGALAQRTTAYNGQSAQSTGSNSVGDTGPPSTNATGNAGGGGSENVSPALGLAPFIRVRLGPTDTIQTLPIAWGPVNGVWQLDTLGNFPKSGVSNIDLVAEIDGLPEPIVQVTAVLGTQGGNASDLKIIGVSRVPFNFREWRADAMKIRVRVQSVGAAGDTLVTLRMSDPVNAGGYIAKQFTETFTNSFGDEFIEARLTKEDLGRDWKPGYMVRFELEFAHPQTFQTAVLEVGKLELNWR